MFKPYIVSQHLIGNVDFKKLGTRLLAVLAPLFHLNLHESLNNGGGMDIASGIFTVPVDGVYHFDFSAVKEASVKHLEIFLKVNGVNYSFAGTSQTATGTLETVSLNASIRLKANDTVKLHNNNGGILYDDSYHFTHFRGWLVDEEI